MRSDSKRLHSPGTASTGAVTSVEHAIQRLLAVIEEENRSLASLEVSCHNDFTLEKNQALRELMALQRANGFAQAISSYAIELRQLKASLTRNARLLKTHIGALDEVANVIVAGMREAESDGTYSRARATRGK